MENKPVADKPNDVTSTYGYYKRLRIAKKNMARLAFRRRLLKSQQTLKNKLLEDLKDDDNLHGYETQKLKK